MGHTRLGVPGYFAALALSAQLCASAALADDNWPTRRITFVVPVGAGTVTDATARVVADYLKHPLRQAIIVENRAGSAATLGARIVARSEPDGYTLLLGGNTTHSVVPSAFKNPPYDPIADFTPIARIGKLGSFLATNPQQPYRSIEGMVEFARANPGKLTYGHGNASGQIMGETIKRRLGVSIIRLPYSSNPSAITDLMGNNIQLMVPDMLTGTSLVETGKIIALAMASKTRAPKLPKVPTLDESILPGFEVLPWVGLFGPAGLDPAVVKKLSDELGKMMSDTTFVTRLQAVGPEAYYMPTEPFVGFVKSDIPVWTEHSRTAGIEPQ